MSGPVKASGKVPYITQEEWEQNKDKYRDQALIVIPDSAEGEELLKRIHSDRRCGECRFFSLRDGQQEIYDTKFILELIKEREMGTLAKAHNWNGFGVCHHWSGSSGDYHITHAFTAARINRWKVEGSKTAYDHRDDSVECPAWERQRGKNIQSFKMTKNSRTRGTD